MRKQLAKARGRFFDAGKQCIIRLLTPLSTRDDDSYIQAYPFDSLVQGMILETADPMWQAVNQGVLVDAITNSGNAPLLAQLIAGKFFQRIATAPKPKGQPSFWDA